MISLSSELQVPCASFTSALGCLCHCETQTLLPRLVLNSQSSLMTLLPSPWMTCIPSHLSPPHFLSISKKVPKYVPLSHPKYLLITLGFSPFFTPTSIASENLIDCTYQCRVPVFPLQSYSSSSLVSTMVSYLCRFRCP